MCWLLDPEHARKRVAATESSAMLVCLLARSVYFFTDLVQKVHKRSSCDASVHLQQPFRFFFCRSLEIGLCKKKLKVPGEGPLWQRIALRQPFFLALSSSSFKNLFQGFHEGLEKRAGKRMPWCYPLSQLPFPQLFQDVSRTFWNRSADPSLRICGLGRSYDATKRHTQSPRTASCLKSNW